MKKITLITILFLGLSLSWGKAQNNHTVVLSLDGFRWDYCNYANTPTLDSLARIGTAAHVKPCFPSVTFPNHYAMATGLYPDKHGIVNNAFWDKDLDKSFAISNRAAVEDSVFWKGEPIWITAQKQGFKTASFFWVGSEVTGKTPDYWKKFDSKIPYKDRVDTVISWLQKPLENRPRLVMWYIEEPDGIGHRFGPTSNEQIRKVEELDSVLNYYFSEARKLPDFENINFIVTSDQIVDIYSMLDASRMEKIVPTSPFLLLYPQKNYIDTAFDILKKNPHLNVWKLNDVPKEYNYGTDHVREGAIVVMADMGYYIQFTKDKPKLPHGLHGYDPNHPDMKGIFFASGPAFKSGYKHPLVFETLNLYNIIARTLNLDAAKNDGKLSDINELFIER